MLAGTRVPGAFPVGETIEQNQPKGDRRGKTQNGFSPATARRDGIDAGRCAGQREWLPIPRSKMSLQEAQSHRYYEEKISNRGSRSLPAGCCNSSTDTGGTGSGSSTDASGSTTGRSGGGSGTPNAASTNSPGSARASWANPGTSASPGQSGNTNVQSSRST
jgi:hypothetical protein